MKQALTITLVAAGPEDKGPPVELRWRRALKSLLRDHGLRCQDMRLAGADGRRDEKRERALVVAAEAMREGREFDPRTEIPGDAEPM